MRGCQAEDTMVRRRQAGALLALGLALGLALATEARAEEVGAVALDHRAWDMPPRPSSRLASPTVPTRSAPSTWSRVGLTRERFLRVESSASSTATAHAAASSPAAHACDPCADRFHFTVLRVWYFRSFVPDKSDPDTLGLEFNSSWGWGSFDVSNISYFEVADYPQAVPGQPAGNPLPQPGAATGIGDFLSAVLFSKKSPHHGPHHFAYGISFQLPTASDDTLGSGKWSVGPAIEYEYHRGRFYAAFVALQLWSVAGDADRKDVAMLMIKPMITYDLSRCWKAVYMPYGITAYWNKKSGQRLYIPLGGGLQRNFKIGSQDMAVSAQLFNYVVRPDKGTQWDLRFMLEWDL